MLFKVPSRIYCVEQGMGGQLHSTSEETKVWERKCPAELKRRQLHTTCLHVILRSVAKKCERKTFKKKGSGGRETFLWERGLRGKARV